MNLQYLSDDKGNTTAVVIPIEDWRCFEKKYKEFEEEKKDTGFTIPEWHVKLGEKERQNIEDGNTEFNVV